MVDSVNAFASVSCKKGGQRSSEHVTLCPRKFARLGTRVIRNASCPTPRRFALAINEPGALLLATGLVLTMQLTYRFLKSFGFTQAETDSEA
jgi:hypothetical protein